jgi:Zinc carboxypeptidase
MVLCLSGRPAAKRCNDARELVNLGSGDTFSTFFRLRSLVIGCRRSALLLLLPWLAPAAAAQEGPLTTAERSGFAETARHADVLAFIVELQRLSPRVRVERMATSAEGREVPLVVIGDPVPASPADLRRDSRAVVYLQANIHGGEVEGKDAALMLARDVALGRTATHYLDRLVILVAPIFNTDGNERISTRNRANQRGPAGGVGERYNGQNLDLNRDGMKLETPEVRGLVNVLNRWDPIFFLDSHTHNGSYHQEPVTWVWGLNPNGDSAILRYSSEVLLPAITARLRDSYQVLSVPHGDFVDPRDPAKGWIPLGPEPRYLSNYVGLRNRIAILNEQYPYVDFETRVRGAYATFLAFLDHVHANRDALVRMAREADGRALGRETFVVATDTQAIAQRLTIRGYEMEVTEGAGGRPRVRPTDRPRTYENVPYLAKFGPVRTMRYPRGYLVAVSDPAVLDNLLAHGIVVERLREPATLTVEAFTIREVSTDRRPNQGHWLTAVKGDTATVARAFPAGTYYVPTAQVLGPLAAALLEPESDDGLLVWNFFDRHLAAQFGGRPPPFPVYKLHEAARLVTERISRAGWE